MAEPVGDDIELRGAGLQLRPYRDGDAEAILEAARESVDAVGRWLPWCHAQYGEADARGWIAHCADGWRSGEHYAFAIFDAQSRFCGAAGLNQRNREHNFMNLGYWIRASRQREGIIGRAARMVSAFGFDMIGLTRIEIVTMADNLASQRVAAQLGARSEGPARNRILVRGAPADALVFGLVPDDLRTAAAAQ